MASSQESRQHSRHPVGFFMVSLKLEIPKLTESSLSPKNVSLGGMKVVVPLKPSVGDHLLCTIELKGIRYENCSAKVAWVQEIKGDTGSCEVGLAIDLEGDARANFHEAIMEHLKDEGNIP